MATGVLGTTASPLWPELILSMVQYLLGTAEKSLRTAFFSSFQLPHSPELTSAGPARPLVEDHSSGQSSCQRNHFCCWLFKEVCNLLPLVPGEAATLLMIFCQLNIIRLFPFYWKKFMKNVKAASSSQAAILTVAFQPLVQFRGGLLASIPHAL